MATKRPPRVIDPYSEEFWGFTQDNELRLQRCTNCGELRWPPSEICDQCLSSEYTWDRMSGEGRLVSWTIFHRTYFPEYPAPHNSIVVELTEGPLFVSTTPPEVPGSTLRAGMPMHLTWLDGEDGHGEYNLPAFAPA